MAPTPVDRERDFAPPELFFSTTDPRGIILTGNAVFSRVSGYAVDELHGRPHSLIRHPDMPRIVFKALWDTIEAGQPIAAYVKNMARTGEYYWVVATVVPIEGGYLSVRFKPSTPLKDTAEAIYRELRAVEAQVEDAGGGKLRAMEASGARLGEILAAAGFPSYADFMHAMLPAELASRAAIVAAGPRREPVTPMAGDPRAQALETIRASCGEVWSYLDGLLHNLDGYTELGGRLSGKSRFVTGLAERMRTFALNAVIAAGRLNGSGATLAAVARLMRERSEDTAALIHALSADIDAAVDLLADLAFRISVARLQAETAIHFCDELLAGAAGIVGSAVGKHARGVGEDLCTLSACIGEGVGRVTGQVNALDDRLTRIGREATGLDRSLGVLSILQVNGAIEAARLDDAVAFRVLFGEVREQVDRAGEAMADFAAVAGVHAGATADAAAMVGHVARIREAADLAVCACV